MASSLLTLLLSCSPEGEVMTKTLRFQRRKVCGGGESTQKADQSLLLQLQMYHQIPEPASKLLATYAKYCNIDRSLCYSSAGCTTMQRVRSTGDRLAAAA